MKFRKSLLAFAGAVAVFAVLGHYFARPLLAQARAALVRDVDNPALAPFVLDTTFNLTTLNSQQLLVTVPAGKRLVIENVSYVSGGVSSDQLVYGSLRSSEFGAIAVLMGINPPHAAASPGYTLQDGSQASKVYFDSGQEVWASASHNTGGSRTMEVVLSGYWITP